MTWRIRAFSSATDAQNWLDELESQGWQINDVRLAGVTERIVMAVALSPSLSYNDPLASSVLDALAVDKRWGNVE